MSSCSVESHLEPNYVCWYQIGFQIMLLLGFSD
jgi:hypothetical protein